MRSPDSKNTLLEKLFFPSDMYKSYKAFFSDEKIFPNYVSTVPLNSTDKRCCKTD